MTCKDCMHFLVCEKAYHLHDEQDVEKRCKHYKNEADYAEVKHGEWIEKEEVYGDVYYTCSNCNNDWTTIDGTPQDNFMNYCPHCGAKMEKGEIHNG